MTTTTTTTLGEQLAPLAARLAQLQEAADLLAQQIDDVKAQIRDTVPGPDNYAAGPLTVQVQTNGRLDTKAIAAKYPPTQHPELYSQTVDVRRVRQQLAPVDLEALTAYGTPKVVLR